MNDKRTLLSMLQIEANYTIGGNYFLRNGSRINVEMRAKLATWMLEVCEEQECTDEVFANAMSTFDRLMCVLNNVEVQHLQLIGAVCLFISSKLASTESNKLTASKLVDYTDNSVSLEDLLEWELFVMDSLRWDVAALVPNDFIEMLINQLQLDVNICLLKKHCFAFTAMCATDFKFSMYPPSLIASACLLTALEGLNKLNNSTASISQVAKCLHELAQIDLDCLVLVKDQVDELFKQSAVVEEPVAAVQCEEDFSEIQFEDDYDFDIDFNMKINDELVDITNTIKKSTGRPKRLVSKASILSPASSRRSSRSSSGVSSAGGVVYLNNSFMSANSPASFNSSSSSASSSYYTNQEIVSMMMVTPPLANSLPMPEFEKKTTQKRVSRRKGRQSQMTRC